MWIVLNLSLLLKDACPTHDSTQVAAILLAQGSVHDSPSWPQSRQMGGLGCWVGISLGSRA